MQNRQKLMATFSDSLTFGSWCVRPQTPSNNPALLFSGCEPDLTLNKTLLQIDFIERNENYLR